MEEEVLLDFKEVKTQKKSQMGYRYLHAQIQKLNSPQGGIMGWENFKKN